MHKSEIQDRKIFVSYLILVSFCTLSYLKLIRHQCKNDMDFTHKTSSPETFIYFLCFFMSHHNLSNNNCTQMINSYIIILSFLQKYLFTLGNEVKCKINSFFFSFFKQLNHKLELHSALNGRFESCQSGQQTEPLLFLILSSQFFSLWLQGWGPQPCIVMRSHSCECWDQLFVKMAAVK